MGCIPCKSACNNVCNTARNLCEAVELKRHKKTESEEKVQEDKKIEETEVKIDEKSNDCSVAESITGSDFEYEMV